MAMPAANLNAPPPPKAAPAEILALRPPRRAAIRAAETARHVTTGGTTASAT